MYQKIMIPTDGSELSTQAALKGIAFAADNKAEVLAVFVAPEYQYPVYIEIVPPSYPVDKEYADMMKKTGATYLAPLKEAAEKAGLKFTGQTVMADSPAVAIADLATENNCDLIFMGSHGRSGIGQLFLGSVTSKLLNVCSIPVLVHKMPKKKK